MCRSVCVSGVCVSGVQVLRVLEHPRVSGIRVLRVLEHPLISSYLTSMKFRTS